MRLTGRDKHKLLELLDADTVGRAASIRVCELCTELFVFGIMVAACGFGVAGFVDVGFGGFKLL